VPLLKQQYFCKGNIRHHYIKSSVWHGIKVHMDTVIDNSIWVIGNGGKINLWLDNWLGAYLVSIMNIAPSNFSYSHVAALSFLYVGYVSNQPSLLYISSSSVIMELPFGIGLERCSIAPFRFSRLLHF